MAEGIGSISKLYKEALSKKQDSEKIKAEDFYEQSVFPSIEKAASEGVAQIAFIVPEEMRRAALNHLLQKVRKEGFSCTLYNDKLYIYGWGDSPPKEAAMALSPFLLAANPLLRLFYD